MKKSTPKVEQTLMLKILHEEKLNKILFFIIWVITFVMLIISVLYIINLHKSIGTTTDTIEIEDVQTIDNSHIKIGDDEWVKSE